MNEIIWYGYICKYIEDGKETTEYGSEKSVSEIIMGFKGKKILEMDIKVV